MRLIQCIDTTGVRKVGIVEKDTVQFLRDVSSTYQLFQKALGNHISMEEQAKQLASGQYQSYENIASQGKILVPLDHPDPYHAWLTGTGLTHLGSAASRDSMHQKLQNKQELTDSMKMFQMGLENGKMRGNTPASQPEWFYKGNGLGVVHPDQPLLSPAFALDGGEEPEIVGLYIIDADGNPRRLGFALGNEFSDHRMERINYLYLAHSKLRPCSFGPELLLGELPGHITGMSRIYRNGGLLWEKEFLTGEENMSHNLANLEHHHFKYEMFRQPGDVHVHFFGTSVLSFANGITTQDGDIFEIEAEGFGRPLRNKLQVRTS
ncbi:FAH family protein [Rhodocytophaga rosea]|uniref:FAH family protein n=1 Tax=Rhodocytophaga rosea TaxID=2704465 RepID=A0A6C0GM07_9BACT|nr:AraD1 family protein [Rhodocytophaga rosea]QHT68652.1 FAH family protein [Rhodocytophaga rosea]